MPTVHADVTMVKPPVKLSFQVGGIEYSSKVKRLEINLPADGQANFSANFEDYSTTGDFPFLATPANAFGFKHHNRFIVDQSIYTHPNEVITDQTIAVTGVTNVVSINLTSLGMTTPGMPLFLGGGWQDNTPDGAWTGYDFTYFLTIPNQNMKDIVETSPTQMAQATFQLICARYGITNVQMGFPNFRIRQLRRDRGTALSWLNRIRKVSQSHMRFRGSSLNVQPYIINTSPQWTFKAGVNMTKFTWKEADPPTSNRFLLTRLDPMAGILGKQGCVGGSCPGRTINITINPPCNNLRCSVSATEGHVTDWVFVTVDGQYIPAVADGVYIGAAAVKQALATYYTNDQAATFWIPGIPLPGTFTPAYNIVAYGGNNNGFTTHYKQQFDDLAHQSDYGIWEDYTNIEDAIIPDIPTLLSYGYAVCLESTRKQYTGTIDFPYINPNMEPGQFCLIKSPLSGIMDNTVWFIEHIKLLYENSSWSSVITVSRGIGSTNIVADAIVTS